MDNNKQYIREGQKVTFSAQLEKGDRRLTSWIVYEGNQCDDNHIVKEEKQIGTEFSHIFEKAGEYTIVSYGKRDEINESTAIRAQVEEEFIFEGIECLSPASICYKEEGVWKVKIKIESREEREERLKNKKREPKEGDVGFQVKFKDNKIPTKLEFRIKFKGEAAQIIKKGNAIWYTPVYPNKKGEKFDIIVKFSNTEIIEPMVVLTELPPFENVVDHKNVGVTQITTIPEGIQELRPRDSLKLNFNPKLCFIAGEPEINPSNLVWKLNGNTLLAKGTQIEIPREIIANNKGENKVEVFKNNASTKSIASYNFSVVKNEIIKFDVSETPKFGKEVTFEVKEMTFSKLEANEEVYWEVRQGCNLVPPVAGFTFKHLFNKEGVFKVRCYISDVVVEKEYNIIQPKILANTAKWIDKDGASANILNTAGYDQEVYVYVEHLELGGEEVVVEVYNAKDKNTPIFTSKKITVPLDSKNFTFLYPIKKTYKGKTAEEKKKEDKERKDFQIFFKIKSIGTCVSSNDFEKNLLTITNRGDVVNAYFCDADDTKIYRAIEVGTIEDLHFKLYMTNMLKREVEILFYIFKPFPTTIPAKDCLNWVHWEKIASHFSKKQPFHTTKAIVNNKGEILVKVPTSKLIQIGDFTSVVAVFKIMGSDGKVKGAYLERRNTLMLFSNKALTHMKENFAPVKVKSSKVDRVIIEKIKVQEEKDIIPPWLKIAIEKLKMAKGTHESSKELFPFAKECLLFSGSNHNPDDNVKGQWCAAFVSWCLNAANQKVGKKGGQRLRSQAFIELAKSKTEGLFKIVDEPILGCIVVMTNYEKETQKPDGSGHITFLYGINGENLVCVGGNQDSRLRFSNYKRSGVSYSFKKKKGETYKFYQQKFNCFLMPIDYPESLYNKNIPIITADEANKKYGLNLKTKENESTH